MTPTIQQATFFAAGKTSPSAARNWLVADIVSEEVDAIASELSCPRAIAHILAARGITDRREFLSPTLEDLHDPSLLQGMPEAVARIQRALATDEPILIYGDYDVDGTTATVLLKTAIERTAPSGHPAKVTYHVPHRIREGYGMQTTVLAVAADAGIRLVISVDTGIRAFAAAAEARALCLDLIVTDHHLPDLAIPEAHAVVNPAQPGCPYPNKHLCGAAVAFKLAHALMSANADASPNPVEARRMLNTKTLPSFLKLVAIATIADSVPLTGENRTIAVLGLRALANPLQPGLRALMEIAGLALDRAPTATDVGFRLAPRINAAGRMDIADDVVELFLTRDRTRAVELASKLDRLNQDRRATEAEALVAIDQELERLAATPGGLAGGCIVLDHPDWHRGILGILASRVVDRTGQPALILTHQDGAAHGSGRSIRGFHLLDALTAIHSDGADLFTRFGGHAYAVGFTLPSDRLHLLRARLASHARHHLTPTILQPALTCDAELSLREIDHTLHDWLLRLAPFGNAATEPIFFTRRAILAAPVRTIKDRHICLRLRDLHGVRTIEALGWSRVIDWIKRAEELGLAPGSAVDIAYRIRTSDFQQPNQIQMELVDLRPHRELWIEDGSNLAASSS